MKILKKILGVVWVNREMEKRVAEHNDNLFQFYFEEDYQSSGESVPYYFYWKGYARLAFYTMLLFSMVMGYVIIQAILASETIPTLVLLALLVGAFIALLMDYTPNYYQFQKKRFNGNVRVIRLHTRKVIERFEHDYERAEALAKPYREQREKKEAEEKAAEEEKQRLKAEAKAQKAEELRETFRPQYMALLQYVETYYKVSTPDPDVREGFFTIALPGLMPSNKKTEMRFAYANEESDLNQLINWMAKIDSVARKRAELHELAKAAVKPNPLR